MHEQCVCNARGTKVSPLVLLVKRHKCNCPSGTSCYCVLWKISCAKFRKHQSSATKQAPVLSSVQVVFQPLLPKLPLKCTICVLQCGKCCRCRDVCWRYSFHPETGGPLHDESVMTAQKEPDLHLELHQREVDGVCISNCTSEKSMESGSRGKPLETWSRKVFER